jgi:energy-coupling factor transporter ATP-binding protein EcfA2
MSELIVNELTLKFANKVIFEKVSFIGQSGQITMIKGKNGSGKTSLLQCLCSVIPKHFPATMTGEITVTPLSEEGYGGSCTTSQSRDTIYGVSTEDRSTLFGDLMQEPDKQLCFPYLEEELLFGAENLQRNFADFQADYAYLLKLFPFLQKADAETNALSFGQKKALLLAGMILKDPDIFLLDEPSAGLSEDFREKFTELITMLKNKGKIIIIAEHDCYFDTIADQCVFLAVT